MARAVICISLMLRSASAGMTDMMKDMVCSSVKVPIVCSSSSRSTGGSSASCTGPECCASSSCYSIPGSMFACKSSRGPCTCEGASTFPVPKAGVCKCRYGSCSVAGICPDQTGTRLYETGEEEVPPEDFTQAFAGLGLFCGCLLVTTAAFALRLRPRARFVSSDAEVLGVSDSEALMGSTME